jgi:ubiquinone biosynthesis protein
MVDFRSPTPIVHPRDRPPVAIKDAIAPGRFPVLRATLYFLNWFWAFLWLRSKGSAGRAEYAKLLRLLLEELGGLWVKIGQLLSLRVDLFSAEFCQELALLQDRATGFPFRDARRIIEESLGAPLSQIFDEFDETPFAAASIGQIHRAHLRVENVWVAVKVQRPYLTDTMAGELAAIGRIARLLDALSIRSYVRWTEFHWELERIMEEEVDYQYEASNMRRMRKTLRRHNIYVPKVFKQYISQRVLVTEFVAGALMADFIKLNRADPIRSSSWLQQNNIDPELLAERLCLSLLRQVVEDNLYHGDLHPGNIILMRDSRVTLLDFGAIGFTEKEYLEKFRLFLRSLATRDYNKAADLSLLLSERLPLNDLEPAKEDIVRALRAWGGRTFVPQLPYHEKSVNGAWLEIAQIYMKHKCTHAWTILRIQRAFMTLDASVIHLCPQMNFTNLTERYFRRAERRALRQLGDPRGMRKVLGKFPQALEIPEKVWELVFFNAALVRRHGRLFEGTTTKASNLFAVLFGNLATASAIAFAAIAIVLLERHAPGLLGQIGTRAASRIEGLLPDWRTDAWLLFLAIDVYVYFTARKLQRRFDVKEPRPVSSTETG